MQYQVKSQKKRFGRTYTNSAYEAKIEAIRSGNAPNYTFLRYDRTEGLVRDVFLVPRHLLVESFVRRRNELQDSAERAGWVGSVILLGDLPQDAKIPLVVDGEVRSERTVRSEFKRLAFLHDKPANQRDWTTDVLACIRRLGKDSFTLAEVYAFAEELSHRHPANRNVKPKIRQQLQLLRDKRVLVFEGRGRYRFRSAPPPDVLDQGND